MLNCRFKKLAGNAEKYSVINVPPLAQSPIKGKHILYLGSSVTYGWASLSVSFVEYISKRNGTTFVKEAVGGTTLAATDSGDFSYVNRLKKLDKSIKFDLFICQLSTNDAMQNIPLGNIDGADPSTVCGAINIIIDYVRSIWKCPVVFYTNAYFKNENYFAMVQTLNKIADRKKITVADLYSNVKFNAIKSDRRALYMADEIHPTQAGYLEWWTPEIERVLYETASGSMFQAL